MAITAGDGGAGVEGMRRRPREILLAAAPAIAVATAVRVMSPFAFRAILASGRPLAVIGRQMLSVDFVVDFLIFFVTCLALAAFVHIDRSRAGAQRAYERLAQIGLALLRLALLLGAIWIVAFSAQYWALLLSPRFRTVFLSTGRGTWRLVVFVCVSVFVGLLISVPALSDREHGAFAALRSAVRLMPRVLLGCALLVLIFDVGANALINLVSRSVSSAAVLAGINDSVVHLVALIGYICTQIVRCLGFYALVCLYFTARGRENAVVKGGPVASLPDSK